MCLYFTDETKKNDIERVLEKFKNLDLSEQKSNIDKPKTDCIFIRNYMHMMVSILLTGILSD